MARPGNILELFIVIRPDIPVAEDYGHGRACSEAVQHPAKYLWLIGFQSRCSSFGTAFSPQDVRNEVRFRYRQARTYSVEHYPYRFPMRFSEDGDSEYSAECVHIVYNLQFSEKFHEGREGLGHAFDVVNDYRSVCAQFRHFQRHYHSVVVA